MAIAVLEREREETCAPVGLRVTNTNPDCKKELKRGMLKVSNSIPNLSGEDMNSFSYEAPKPAAIYSFAALKSKQREIKNRADHEVVHITENGNAAYVFCSEEVFAQEKAQAIEDALYDAELRSTIEAGQADVVAGRYTVGAESAIARMREVWGEND